MEDDANSWNYENVYAFFEPDVAKQILQIPISRYLGKILHVGHSLAMVLIQYVQVTALPARLNFFTREAKREA
jgi:hypothetical protein